MQSTAPVTPGTLLRDGTRLVRRGCLPVVALAYAMNVLLILGVEPLISLLFCQVLLMNGLPGLDFGNLHLTPGLIPSLLLLFGIGLIGFAVVVLQLALILFALQQIESTGRLRFRGVFASLGRLLKKLLRPSSIPLFLYLFLLLPISGLGFLSSLTQVIAVPNFVSGELLKDPLTAVLWNALMLVILWVNIRFALTLPIFCASEAGGRRAMAMSWRAMRGRTFWVLLIATFAVLLIAALVAILGALAGVLPTVLMDLIAPAASPVVAAFSLAAVGLLLLLLLSGVAVLVLAILATLAKRTVLQGDPGKPAKPVMPAATAMPASAAEQNLALGARGRSRRAHHTARTELYRPTAGPHDSSADARARPPRLRRGRGREHHPGT